jgi:hypothetical protein
MKINDMPKLESPFIRKLNEKGEYLVTSEINQECAWIFEGDENDVLATEKLDGTNVSIIIENGKITRIFNRTNEIPFFNKGSKHIIEAVLNSFERRYCDFTDGQYFGEVIGPKLNGNPYQLNEHLWIPFDTYCRNHLAYKSWHKYPKTFENIKNWFFNEIKDGGIFSLFMKKRGIDIQPEGIVFHNLKTGQMCKLRRDMFEGFKVNRHNDGLKREEKHE